MLSKRAKYRIAANKRARKQLWKLRRQHGLNRALWPSPWTIWYNSLDERAGDVFGEIFFPIVRYEPDEAWYTTAYHRQAERADRNEEIAAIMSMPKAIDYPGLRERILVTDPRHPLHFGKLGWSPEITAVLALNPRTGWRELKVTPSHRHHHWPDWAYEPIIN